MTITVPDPVRSAGACSRGEVGSARVVVVDTSVLVADPESMYAFGTADVVIPLTVLEELDELKARPDDVGRCARTAVRLLEELRTSAGGTLDEPVGLPSGGTLRIELNGLRADRLTELHLDPDKPDNRILAAALGVTDAHRRVELVSADGSLRVKAAALGIEAADYTRAGTTTRASSGQIATLEVPREVIDSVFAHHAVPVDLVVEVAEAPVPDAQNAAVLLRAGASQSVLCRRRGGELRQVPTDQSAWELRPRSAEQRIALDLLMDPEVPVVSLEGHAGTGKTILALAAGLEQCFNTHRYRRMMILRPVVAVGRQEIGYLPGDLDDKLGPWFEAIVDALVALGDNISHREAKGMLDGWAHEGRLTMGAVTHLRGRSLQDTWVMIDESQNFEISVLKTVLTRLGEGSKIACVGDVTQIDSPFLSERTNALSALGATFEDSPLFGHVKLSRGERSQIADLAAARL